MSMTIRFLNKRVEREVLKSKELYLIWMCSGPYYDADIDPLHRAEYVENAQRREEQLLEILKENLTKLTKEFEEQQ